MTSDVFSGAIGLFGSPCQRDSGHLPVPREWLVTSRLSAQLSGRTMGAADAQTCSDDRESCESHRSRP